MKNDGQSQAPASIDSTMTLPRFGVLIHIVYCAIFAGIFAVCSHTEALAGDQQIFVPYHPQDQVNNSSRPGSSQSSNSSRSANGSSSRASNARPVANFATIHPAPNAAPSAESTFDGASTARKSPAASVNHSQSEQSPEPGSLDAALPSILKMQDDEQQDVHNAAVRSNEREPDNGTAVIHPNNSAEPFMVEEQAGNHRGNIMLEDGQDRISRGGRGASQQGFPQQWAGNRRRPGLNRNYQNQNQNQNQNNNFTNFNNLNNNNLNGVYNFNNNGNFTRPNSYNSNNSYNFSSFSNNANDFGSANSFNSPNSFNNPNGFNNRPNKNNKNRGNNAEKRDPLAATFDTSPRAPDKFADNPLPDADGVRHFANGKHFDLSKMSLDQAIDTTNASTLDPNQGKSRQRDLLTNGVVSSLIGAGNPSDLGAVNVPYRPRAGGYPSDPGAINIPYRPRRRQFDDSPQQIRPHRNRRGLRIQNYGYPDF